MHISILFAIIWVLIRRTHAVSIITKCSRTIRVAYLSVHTHVYEVEYRTLVYAGRWTVLCKVTGGHVIGNYVLYIFESFRSSCYRSTTTDIHIPACEIQAYGDSVKKTENKTNHVFHTDTIVTFQNDSFAISIKKTVDQLPPLATPERRIYDYE